MDVEIQRGLVASIQEVSDKSNWHQKIRINKSNI